jgi:hypothetical protein
LPTCCCVTLALIVPAILALPALMKSIRSYGSKSSVLSPLLWFAFIMLGAIVAAAWVHASTWLLVIFTVVFALDAGLILVMYVVFVAKGETHQLRSETYSLQHMAIARGLVGDNVVGLNDPGDPDGVRQIEGPSDLPMLEGGERDADDEGN